MDNQIYNQIVSFIWSIADDCLFNVYVRGKYRDVILPMTVIRRLDAVLEDTKEKVQKMKSTLDKAGILNQDEALCNVAQQSFCNKSQFRLKDLTSRSTVQRLKTDFIAYLDGFSPNFQEILEKFKFRNQMFLRFKENEYSKIFDNSDFGYWKITVFRPLKDEKGSLVLDKRGQQQVDKELTDTEQIPLNYVCGIRVFFKKEVIPYTPDAYIDESKTQIGYEISFTKHFYKSVQLRTLDEITADIRTLEQETSGLLENILNN